jgi:hypothetical protein
MTKKSSSSNSSLDRIKKLFKRNKTESNIDTSKMTRIQYAFYILWYYKLTIFSVLLACGIIGGIIAYFLISKSQNKDQDTSTVAPIVPSNQPNNTYVDPDICKKTETSRVILYNATKIKSPINHAINNNNEDIKTPVIVDQLSIPSNEQAFRDIETIYIGSFKIRNCKIVLSTFNKFTENSTNIEYVHNTSDTKDCLEIDLKKEHPTLIFQSAYIEPNREVIIYVNGVKDPIILKHNDIKEEVTRGNISVSSIKIRNCTVTLKKNCNSLETKYIEPEVLKHYSRNDLSFYKEKTGITDVNCVIIKP